MQLTEYEGYAAMILFLKEYSRQVSNPDPLILLLHDVEVAPDNVPNDPAMWGDWLAALAKVKCDGLGYDPEALEDRMRRESEARLARLKAE